MTLDEIKNALAGRWVSIAPELRPSSLKNPDGTIKPFYLSREFSYQAGDRFELVIHNFADPFGHIPIARMRLAGHMTWRGPHAIASGAQKVDFVADEAYAVTPLAMGFVDVLNHIAGPDFSPWSAGESQSVFGKAFAPFGLVAGRHFQEFDLVYVRQHLLFWGARHVDGRGFDTEDNRPTNLQIPLTRATDARGV